MKVGQLVKVVKGPLSGSEAYVIASTDSAFKLAMKSSETWVLKEYVEIVE